MLPTVIAESTHDFFMDNALSQLQDLLLGQQPLLHELSRSPKFARNLEGRSNQHRSSSDPARAGRPQAVGRGQKLAPAAQARVETILFSRREGEKKRGWLDGEGIFWER